MWWMWVGVVLWLGEIKQIAVINFIKRVFGTFWSTGQASPPWARLAPCRAFMAKSTDYSQVSKWFSEPKGTRWRDSLRKGRRGDHVLLQPGNKAKKRQWKNRAPVAGLGQARANLASQVLMMQTQASKQNKLLFVAPHLPDTHLRVVLLFWAPVEARSLILMLVVGLHRAHQWPLN